jgi:hypothetical protein
MEDLTRRSFLRQTSVGAATLGLLPAVPALAAVHVSPETAVTQGSAPVTGPIIAHVSDVTRGEIALLVGSREIIFRDPRLVARLLKAAR